MVAQTELALLFIRTSDKNAEHIESWFPAEAMAVPHLLVWCERSMGHFTGLLQAAGQTIMERFSRQQQAATFT